MAKNKNNNDITYGLSGRLGNMISFRQIAGETEAFRRPGKRTKAPNAAQLEIQDRFLKASWYGRSVMADPAQKALYQAKVKGRKSAYNLALMDSLKAPVVHLIETNQYKGQAGDTIRVSATDDFKVVRVKVSLFDPAGELLEEGDAVAVPGGMDWLFTPGMENENVAGTKIKATAYDLPGNSGVMEVTV